MTRRKKGGGWPAQSRRRMQRKGTVGSLHRALGVPQGKKIGMSRLQKAKHSSNPKIRKKANWALNMNKRKRKR